MTTKQYFQARFEKAQREYAKAETREQRIAAYERMETAKRQVALND